MISVEEADRIIGAQHKDYGVEKVLLTAANGRTLAEALSADRDLPPHDRVTMDGVALRYADAAAGCTTFKIAATQAAGDPPIATLAAGDCIEIMTGAAMPESADTVVPYENLTIRERYARLGEAPLRQGQNIHRKGSDCRQGEIVVPEGQRIAAAHISMAASIGKTHLLVKKLPTCVIVSSGDELVDVADTPLPYQIRRSNNYAIRAALEPYGIQADMLHIPDQADVVKREIGRCIGAYDVLILSGGISMGKFDYIPAALEALSVQKLFHKVRQRPGKPFWFGVFEDKTLVFALPGNPVSTFMCLHRYCIPWLVASLGLPAPPPIYAVLSRDIVFQPPLQYFLQVKLRFNTAGQLTAEPLEGNGSGDFSNLLATTAFMELPAEKNHFYAGEVYRVWPFGAPMV